VPEGWGWKQRRRADTKPFHYSRACCAHAPLHAGRRRHAAATCDLSCGQRRQRARATAPAVARGALAGGCDRRRTLAVSNPLCHPKACWALTPLHAGRRRHAAATCDLSCGQRRQRARATAPAVARGGLAGVVSDGGSFRLCESPLPLLALFLAASARLRTRGESLGFALKVAPPVLRWWHGPVSRSSSL
jgi:hypothetical protein